MNSSSLSVGDVVSAGLRIYRDRFKVYFPLAIIAALWVIVPFCVLILFISAWVIYAWATYFKDYFSITIIAALWLIIFIYGWAKYVTASGLISRLAFGEITEKPESVTEARNQVNPLIWTFLLGSLLVGLIFLGVVLGVIYFPIFSLGFFILYLWLFTRLSLVELIIGIEKTSKATKALGRSWSLTKSFVCRLLLINFVAYLITIPIYFAANLITGIIQNIMIKIMIEVLGEESAVASQIIFVFFLSINVLFIVITIGITMPFWQSIKAAIYYDLRIQREGIDLL